MKIRTNAPFEKVARFEGKRYPSDIVSQWIKRLTYEMKGRSNHFTSNASLFRCVWTKQPSFGIDNSRRRPRGNGSSSAKL